MTCCPRPPTRPPPLQVVIFPKTPEHLKTSTAEEAFNPNGLAQRSISLLKDKYPDLEVRCFVLVGFPSVGPGVVGGTPGGMVGDARGIHGGGGRDFVGSQGVQVP